MGDSRATAGEPPGPEGVASLDELVERLQALRVWYGVSYRELHRRLVYRRRARGIPEEPAYATVYRCLQPGRHRLDIDLVTEIAAELTNDDTQADRWRQVHTQIVGDKTTAAHATVLDRLPDDLVTFTGRDTELDLILGHARQGHGVIAIEGMAGVGKTTLAVRAAHRIAEDNPLDLLLYVNLRGHDPERTPVEPMAALDGLLRHLGMTGGRIQALDLAQRGTQFRDLIAHRPILILFDNAASTDQVEPLLPDPTDAVALVTSRHRVVRRPAADHVELDVFPPDDALALLSARAGEAIEAAPDVAARIVDQVGRLPLALALVAARIEAASGWTLRDHLDQLIEHREALRLDQGVDLAFLTSYESLPPSSRRLLRLLALHPGRDCDAFAAAALAGVELRDVESQLANLASGSLINARIAERYELHDLVRIFALNLAREEDAPSARRTVLARLSDHYRWAATLAMDVYAPEERIRRPRVPESDTATPTVTDRARAIAWLEAERSNLIAVASYAAEHGWDDHVGDLSAVLAPYLRNTGHYEEADSLHECASSIGSIRSRGIALKNLAVIRWHRGRRSEAMGLFQDALKIASQAGDHFTRARILNNLGSAHYQSSHYADSLEDYQRALTEYRESDDPVGEGVAVFNLANTLLVMGRYDEALDHYERSLALNRAADNRAIEARILENLGRLYNRLERYDDAQGVLQSGIVVAQEVGDRVGEAEVRSRLGTTYARVGRLKDAVRMQERALSGVTEHGHIEAEIDIRNALSDTLCRLDHGRDALTHARMALTMAADLDDPYRRASSHQATGMAYNALGDVDAARVHRQQALALFTRLGTPEVLAVRTQLAELECNEPVASSGREQT